jgi:hypothetical protein
VKKRGLEPVLMATPRSALGWVSARPGVQLAKGGYTYRRTLDWSSLLWRSPGMPPRMFTS